ncbi:MAG: hypothetical protein KDD89_10075, partial [Anaerolineales bacterium]|nr:hypothetical protein [Anaerolineales bacterium]
AVVDNGSCAEASGTVTCNIDAVLGERSNTMTVVVTPTIAGTYVNTVTVTAGSFVTTTSETVMAFDPANLPGTVTIIKDAVPNTATPFDFNTTLGSSFSLVDNEQYTPTGPAININFQSSGAAVPTGYLRDYGQAYALRLSNNQGNGAYRYGWISQDSVGEPTAVPLDLIGNGRDRNILSDQRLDTTLHMQYNDVGGTSGVLIPGAWEIALPEDLYLVSVTLGDATTPGAAPENYDLSIEGVKVIDDFVPSGGPGDASQFVTAQTAVTVSDGRLTVDAIGGSNTKIVSLSIVPVTADNEEVFTFVFPGTYTVTEQAVPFWELDAISCVDSDGAGTPSTGDVGTATATINVDGGENVVCTFTNLEGNRPPVIAPVADQFTAEGATLNVSTAVTDSTGDVLTITVSSTPDASSFFTPTVTQNGAGDYTLAIDFAPQVGDMGVYTITMQAEDGVNPAVVSDFLLTVTDDPLASVTVIKDAVPDSDTSFTFSFRRPNNNTTVFALIDAGSPYITGVTGAYNFQTGSSPDPAGFTGETGAAYGLKANGESYGWLRLADNTPVTASSVTRYRQRDGIPLELDTIIHVQRGDCCASGFTDEIYWEHAVPNGLYEVTVSVGDEPSGSTYDSLHSVRAEGITLLDQFQATAVEEYTQTVGLVTVSDGRLTIDAVGGTNTKFNYVQFQQLIPATNTRTFTNLLPGGYTVSETIPADWLLTNLVCDDADGSIDLENATASLSLSSGENVTCTFTN